MNVIFRVDASVEIGSGHVMRCLTLALALRDRGASVSFISRAHVGHLCSVVEGAGFSVSLLPPPGESYVPDVDAPAHAAWLRVGWEQDVLDTRAVLGPSASSLDWLVVDHYALDVRWERAMRADSKLLVIDDLADRAHDSDVLLDQNCLPDQPSRYSALLPPYCRPLLGTQYTLLRPEFLAAAGERRHATGPIRRAFVSFGGVDAANHTAAAIHALSSLDWPQLTADVVVGAANGRSEQLRGLCAWMPSFNFHRQVTNVAALMADADVALIAGGFTSYEAAFLGVPSLLLPLSRIQAEVAQQIAAGGAATNLGLSTTFPASDVVAQLRELNENAVRRAAMADAGRRMFDGQGACRVANAMLGNEGVRVFA